MTRPQASPRFPIPTANYRDVDDRPADFLDGSGNVWMTEWVCSRLDDWFVGACDGPIDGELSEVFRQAHEQSPIVRALSRNEAAAVEAAEQGNIEPLRLMFPRHAKFINFPKNKNVKKGEGMKKRQPAPFKGDIVDPFADPRFRRAAARDDAARIRAMWKKYYDKVQRPTHLGLVTAEKIAADRWGIGEDEIKIKIAKKRKKKPAALSQATG